MGQNRVCSVPGSVSVNCFNLQTKKDHEIHPLPICFSRSAGSLLQQQHHYQRNKRYKCQDHNRFNRQHGYRRGDASCQQRPVLIVPFQPYADCGHRSDGSLRVIVSLTKKLSNLLSKDWPSGLCLAAMAPEGIHHSWVVGGKDR